MWNVFKKHTINVRENAEESMSGLQDRLRKDEVNEP